MKTSDHLRVGSIYSRNQLREAFAIKDATINTGVFRPKGYDSIWLFVTENKPPDRTQYADSFDGITLKWDGQTSGRTDEWIINHRKLGMELLLFYRKSKYESPGAGFRYSGAMQYKSHHGNKPTHFILTVMDDLEEVAVKDINAQRIEDEYFEGTRKERFASYYERNPLLRAAAIRAHGLRCAVCGFDFQSVYGQRGSGFIELHHIKPVSTFQGAKKVDPVSDMAPVCANCHRMIHRRTDKILSVDELRNIVSACTKKTD